MKSSHTIYVVALVIYDHSDYIDGWSERIARQMHRIDYFQSELVDRPDASIGSNDGIVTHGLGFGAIKDAEDCGMDRMRRISPPLVYLVVRNPCDPARHVEPVAIRAVVCDS